MKGSQWREDQHLPTPTAYSFELVPEYLPWPCQWGRAEGGEGISGSSVHPLESMAWGMWSLESASFLEVSNDSGLAHNSVVYLRRIWGRGCWPTLPLKCMMAITHSSSAKGKSYGTTQVATKWRLPHLESGVEVRNYVYKDRHNYPSAIEGWSKITCKLSIHRSHHWKII